MKRMCSVLAFLLVLPAASQATLIGDFVWEDSNRNGLQEPGEPGVAGVTVTLWTPIGGFPTTQIDTTTTDAAGIYSFTGVDPGDYVVEFSLPDAYARFTEKRAGNDPTIDSNAGSFGFTDLFTVFAGQDFDRDDIDAGLICDEPGGCSPSGQAPVPSTLVLLGVGLAGIGYQRRKQVKAA